MNYRLISIKKIEEINIYINFFKNKNYYDWAFGYYCYGIFLYFFQTNTFENKNWNEISTKFLDWLFNLFNFNKYHSLRKLENLLDLINSGLIKRVNIYQLIKEEGYSFIDSNIHLFISKIISLIILNEEKQTLETAMRECCKKFNLKLTVIND